MIPLSKRSNTQLSLPSVNSILKLGSWACLEVFATCVCCQQLEGLWICLRNKQVRPNVLLDNTFGKPESRTKKSSRFGLLSGPSLSKKVIVANALFTLCLPKQDAGYPYRGPFFLDAVIVHSISLLKLKMSRHK